MSKKNLILGGILILLVGLAYAYQVPLKKWQASTGKPKNFFSKIDVEKISQIELDRNGKKMILEKKDGKWVDKEDGDFPAKEEYVQGFLNSINSAGTSSLTLVSANKDKKKDFETDEMGVGVKLYQEGKDTISFTVGKYGPDFTSVYVSLAGSNETLSTSASFNSYLSSSEWRDSTVFNFDKEKVNKVRFQYPARQFTVEKKGGNWEKVNKDKIEKIVSFLSTLNAIGIPEQTFKGTGLEKNNIIIQLTGDGIDETIMVGDQQKGSGFYFAKSGVSDRIYLIGKEHRDLLNKKIEDLK